jgi:hypothetical protein
MMKKLLLTSAMLLLSSTAFAQSMPPYMYSNIDPQLECLGIWQQEQALKLQVQSHPSRDPGWRMQANNSLRAAYQAVANCLQGVKDRRVAEANRLREEQFERQRIEALRQQEENRKRQAVIDEENRKRQEEYDRQRAEEFRQQEEQRKRQAAIAEEHRKRQAEIAAEEKEAYEQQVREQKRVDREEAEQASGSPNFDVAVFEVVRITNRGSAIIVKNVLLNNRPECGLRLNNEQVVLKTGDVLPIAPMCASTVTVSIETNRGTANYTIQY